MELKEGFPAFYIFTGAEYADDGTLTTEASYNDLTYFDYKFMLYSNNTSGDQVNTTYTAALCKEVIPKYISDEYYLDQIKQEFGLKYDTFLCPDTPSYNLYYPAWLSWKNELAYEFL